MPMPTVVNVGAVAASFKTITPGMPASVLAGDVLLLFVQNAADGNTTLSGGTEIWTQCTNSPVTQGANRLHVFWARASQDSPTSPTTNDVGDHQMGRIIAFRGVGGGMGTPWTDNPVASNDATSDTSGDIIGMTTTVNNCMMVYACAGNTPDSDGTANFSSWTNANLANVTEQIDNTTAQGGGGALGVATGELATAGASGTMSVTLANAAVKAMFCVELKGAPITVSMGQASETDSALAAGVKKSVSAGQPSETDSALATGKKKSVSAGQASETDSALATGSSKQLATGQASEADSALATTIRKDVTVGQASETDTALAATVEKSAGTRFYIDSGESPEVEPASIGHWDHYDQFVSRRLNTVKQASTILEFAIAYDEETHDEDVNCLWFQGVSAPLAAQTIPVQTIKLVMFGFEDDLANNLFLTWRVAVINSLGVEVKQLLDETRDGIEFGAEKTPTTRYDEAECESYACAAGDRIVVEVGLGGQPSSGMHNGALYAGDDGDDFLAADYEEGGYAPWIEFCHALIFGNFVSVGQASESDSALGLTTTKQKEVGQSSETETVFGVTVSKRVAVGQASEADSAFAISSIRKDVSIGQASESDSAFAPTSTKVLSVGQASETDSAQSATVQKSISLGQAEETDSAQGITAQKHVSLDQAQETDTVFGVSVQGVLGFAEEVDTVFAITIRKSVSVGQTSETETVFGVTVRKDVAVNKAEETDVAQAVSATKRVSIGQAEEVDTAFGVTVSGELGYAEEIDTAFGVTVAKRVAVGQATEVDSIPDVIVVVKRISVGQAIEVDTALALTISTGRARWRPYQRLKFRRSRD